MFPFGVTQAVRPVSGQRLLAALLSGLPSSSTRASDAPENLVLAHNQQLFTIHVNLRAAIFAKQDAVACLDIQCLARAVFLVLAKASGDHFALLWFLFRRVGNDDAAANLLPFIHEFTDH